MSTHSAMNIFLCTECIGGIYVYNLCGSQASGSDKARRAVIILGAPLWSTQPNLCIIQNA